MTPLSNETHRPADHSDVKAEIDALRADVVRLDRRLDNLFFVLIVPLFVVIGLLLGELYLG